MWLFDNTACSIQLLLIEARFSPPSFGHRFVISLESNATFLPHSILKLTVRPNVRIVRWKHTLELLSTSNKRTRQDSCQRPNLLITTRKMQAPATLCSSWIAATTPGCHPETTSTPAPSPRQQVSYQKNWENWWWFVKKTSTELKSFKSEPKIKASSLEATPPVIKFGWKANISRPNEIINWRLSFSDHFKFCTQWVNKPTNSNYQRIGASTMFFMCHYWSKTPPGRGKWTKWSNKWNLMRVTRMRSTKWRLFATARSMQESQQAIYRGSTIWYFRKDIRKKKTPGSHTKLFSTLGSSSAHFIRIIPRNRQQSLRPLTPHHGWPGQQSNQQLNKLPSLPNKSKAGQLRAPRNELKGAELSLSFIVFLAFFRRCGYQLS